ncbi:MAG: ATP-binding protein [Euryarchaeota archaeon]|nr:ATP-binding protein [Euryarchaeota archaeon]
MNSAITALLGIQDVADLQQITIFSSPRVSEEDKARLRAGYPTHYEQVYDFRMITKAGHFPTTRSDVRYFDIYMLPIFSTSGETVEGYLAQYVDITERKKAEAALKDAERLAGIGETAAMIGHDLRNPLQGLQYIVDLQKLRFERVPPEKRTAQDWEHESQLFDRVSEQIFYMDKVVGDLQDYARPISIEPETVALKTLINDVLAALPNADHVEIIVNAGDLKVNVDPPLVHRAFSNLILNAMQAMPQGGTLTIDASASDHAVVINIHDTGIGIPEEIKDKLFSPLITGKAKGTGLGLSVVKRIVEAHKGTINFESKQGHGTTFTMTLPIT